MSREQEANQETSTNDAINFEQTRSVHYEKSQSLPKASMFPPSRGSVKDSPIKESYLEEIDIESPIDSKIVLVDTIKPQELPQGLKNDSNYSSNSIKFRSDHLEYKDKTRDSFSLTSRSRLLHSRLVKLNIY